MRIWSDSGLMLVERRLAMRRLSTWLFVPGDCPERVEKALGSGAEAVIVDLEDGVAANRKDVAREATQVRVQSHSDLALLFIRLNGIATPWLLSDLEAVVGPAVQGVILPKTESATDVALVDWLLTQFESRAGLAPGRIEIIAQVESARGLLAAPELAEGSRRLSGLAFGAADYAVDLGLPERTSGALAFARSSLVVAARSAQLTHIIDTPFFAIDDEAALIADAGESRRLGFTGKLLIHPRQIEPVRQAFLPSAEEVARARSVIQAYEAAGGQGVVSIAGQMVDGPIIERARQTIAVVEQDKRSLGAR